jgi:anti-anti-sigma regulatory factor
MKVPIKDMNSQDSSARDSGTDLTVASLPGGWQVIHVKSRVDSFNQDALIEEIRSLKKQGGKKIAINLKANRFISLPTIKACVGVANELACEGGTFALVSCPEKTKRHFEIYGSLKNIQVYRTDKDLLVIDRPIDLPELEDSEPARDANP